MMVVWR